MAPEKQPKWTIPGLGILLLVVAAAALLRFWYAERLQLWWDEIMTFRLCNEPQTFNEFWELWTSFRYGGDPPLYYLLCYWTGHASFDPSHLQVRLVSLLAGVAAVAYIYQLVRRFDTEAVALATGLAMACSTFAISYSLEHRSYSLLLLTSIPFYDALVLCWQRWSRGRLLYLSVASALMLYTHFFAGIAGATSIAVFLGAKVWSRKWGDWRHLGLRFLQYGGLVCLTFLPMVPFGIRLLRHASVSGGEKSAQAQSMLQMYEERKHIWISADLLQEFNASFDNSPRWVQVAFTSLLVAGVVRLLIVKRWRWLILLGCWTALALLLTRAFYDYMKYPYWSRRNIFMLPVHSYLTGCGLLAVFDVCNSLARLPWRRAAGVAMAGAVLAGFLAVQFFSYQTMMNGGDRPLSWWADWRGMATTVQKLAQPAERVLVPTAADSWTLKHYQFYHELSGNRNEVVRRTEDTVLDELTTASSATWVVVKDYQYLPAALLRQLVDVGQWLPFYGAYLVYYAPPHLEQSGLAYTQKFALQEAQSGSFGPRMRDWNVPLNTKVKSVQVVRPDDIGSTAGSSVLRPGIYTARIELEDAIATRPVIQLFRKLSPGEWQNAWEFNEFAGEMNPPFITGQERGNRYFSVRYNNSVVYDFELAEAGTYKLEVEARSDRPGPITIRIFTTGAGEVKGEYKWDKADNKFETLGFPVKLPAGGQSMLVYYNSFKRVTDAEGIDSINTLDFRRWRLTRID